MKAFFLRLFVSKVDDLIAFLNLIEARLAKIAEQGLAEAAKMEEEAKGVRANAERAQRLAAVVSGAGKEP